MRSASGRREKVVLDGARSQHGELVGITGCSGVTIADLTIQNIKWNGFKINSDRHTTQVTIHNCIIHNIWQRGVKGPAVRPEDRDTFRPSDCRIQYCLFYNDRPKQFSDDPADTPEQVRRRLHRRDRRHVSPAVDDQRQRVPRHPGPHAPGARGGVPLARRRRTASSSGTS